MSPLFLYNFDFSLKNTADPKHQASGSATNADSTNSKIGVVDFDVGEVQSRYRWTTA
jgi:hypothetical protein